MVLHRVAAGRSGCKRRVSAAPTHTMAFGAATLSACARVMTSPALMRSGLFLSSFLPLMKVPLLLVSSMVQPGGSCMVGYWLQL